MTQDDPHREAVRIHELFVQAGLAWFNQPGADGYTHPDIEFSTNRNGDKSAYFRTVGGRVRVSDHGCNTDWRSDIMVPRGVDAEWVNRLAAHWISQAEEIKAQKAAALAAREAHEAPFKARFRSRIHKDHEQAEIVKACYPAGVASDPCGQSVAVRDVLRRWRLG